MKTITRVIAAVMLVAMMAALMTACGQKNYVDNNLVGTWKQTDAKEGNWIWTFNSDHTCKLVGETDGSSHEGTYKIEDQKNGKVKIKLDNWDKEQTYSYTVTEKNMILETFDVSYYCEKQ
ncbi:DUF5640 domain-containing protein [Ruminococcus sp.]|uniref:DUF5640 domain-containing protein n=1 Tax=Ruminococcus sp. TaxID=41978 RepID=UPI00388DEFFD